jgi:YkoY family integral membrane protein
MPLGQTFSISDIPTLFFLAFLEIILSADNAIVLGILSHRLPLSFRRKALWIGVVSAFFFRAGALFALSWLLEAIWLQFLGGLYLLYLAAHHFITQKKVKLPKDTFSFWKTVLLIELFDLAFAIDSILAAVAFIGAPVEGTLPSKLWIVYFGGMLGLIAIRYAAELFSTLIEKFPRLNTSAYLMIGWIGIKLLIVRSIPQFEPLFWTALILLFLSGWIPLKKKT